MDIRKVPAINSEADVLDIVRQYNKLNKTDIAPEDHMLELMVTIMDVGYKMGERNVADELREFPEFAEAVTFLEDNGLA